MPGNRQAFSTAMNDADRHRWDSHWIEAEHDYQRALSEFPDDATARSGLGFCFMQTKRWQLALEEYAYVLLHDPTSVIALSKTAEIYGILGKRDDAYLAYMHLADLYSQAGQTARAEATWQKAVQLSPGHPEPHKQLALYYFEKKDIAQMIQQRLATAQCYLLLNEPAAAKAQCEEVLRADSSNILAQQLLSQLQGEYRRSSAPPSTSTGIPFSSSIRTDTTTESHSPTSGASKAPSSGDSAVDTETSGNTSGGNTGIMGNMGSAGNFGGVSNPAPSMASAGNGAGMNSAPHNRISANQVTTALQQAQTFQAQGRFNDAIDLCEQILESGFDRPDARYFLGWLYQEQQRWDDAIQQFQLLLNDPDYALSCYYSLGQCYRARGDLRTATVHFDEAVDRVNLDALTADEADQLVQLCQEAAEAHRLLGEQEQALTVYNALLGFLRSRGWNEKVAQVEFMLQQAQGAPTNSPSIAAPSQSFPNQPSLDDVLEAPTMAFNVNNLASISQNTANSQPAGVSSSGELPDWLTGILNDSEKNSAAKPPTPPAATAKPTPPAELRPTPPAETTIIPPPLETPSTPAAPPAAAPSWLTDDPKPNATRTLPPEQLQSAASEPAQPMAVIPPTPPVQAAAPVPPPVQYSPAPTPQPFEPSEMILSAPPGRAAQEQRAGLEDLLNQVAGKDTNSTMKQASEAVLNSTANLPESVRLQVVRSMQDIQNYINHSLLTPATEECLRVIDIAPQYLDVHQVLCEIYVRQGKIEQAITKYAILVDTYVVNSRIDDAVATYRRILQLEPNNLTYRMRLINLLSSQGNKEDLLRERTLAAEAYLRLGYMDRAMTELEQALQESPTSVPTRLNYALALQKLGRTSQAVIEYQRVLQVDPRNLTALVRWHAAMITSQGTPRATSLEVLSRIRWQLRGEGQKNADAVIREYNQASDLYPNNADVHFALGQVYHQSGQYDKALDQYTLATRDSSAEVIARASAAQILLTQGKPEAAIQQLEQALQHVRSAPNAMEPATWAARPREEGEEHQAPEVEISLQLAKAYGRSGHQEKMQSILRQVKQGRTSQEEVTSTLGDIPNRQGDMDGAIQEYLEMVRHYRNNRQIDNAMNVLNEMVRLAPQDTRAHNELADLYVSRGLLDEGIAELRLVADLYLRQGQLEHAGEAIQRVGNIYAEMGNNEEALTNLFRAADLNPNSMDLQREVVGFCLQLGHNQDAAKYQTNIARYYFETQQVKEAVAALQQLITIDRSNYEAYDMLGQTYQSVGEYEQASRVYRNLAKVNSGSPIARERLAALQELRSSR